MEGDHVVVKSEMGLLKSETGLLESKRVLQTVKTEVGSDTDDIVEVGESSGPNDPGPPMKCVKGGVVMLTPPKT